MADDEQRRRDVQVTGTALILVIVASIALCLIVLAAGHVAWGLLVDTFKVL
jgi:hypothetical protein